MLLSGTLLFISILVARQRGSRRWLTWVVPASIFAFTLLSGLHLGLSAITGEGLNNAVFYHMSTGLEGADVSQYVPHILGAVLAIGAVGYLLWRFGRFLRGNGEHRHWAWDFSIAGLAIGALAAHPVVGAVSAHVLRFTVVPQLTEGFVTPSTDIAPPEKPRNLVIIYLESLERTYMDPARFPDLTPRLTALESRAVSFTGLGQTVGADFTIGGMVASQCGTPLILTGGANSGKMSRFLSGATCLGDVLATAGYQLSYLGGASTTFAGKGAFYQTHGFTEVSGYDELRPELAEPDYHAEWGLQDDTLFSLARKRFDRLADQDKPFVLTLLTLDTHHPNGHADTNRACAGRVYGDGSNPMLNSVFCDDLLVGQFIEDILSGPNGADTVIAVMSDHLAMVNSAADLLNAGPRRNLLMILDGSRTDARRIDRAGTTLDTGATLLSYLGFDLPRLGFGVDLLRGAKTIPEDLGVSVDDRTALDNHLMGFQAVYDRLWDLPDIAAGAYVNLERKEIQFGSAAYGLPALFAIDADLGISKLTLGDRRANETLAEAAEALPEGTIYLWFDECSALELAQPGSNPALEGLCVLGGEREAGFALRPVERSGFLSRENLSALWANAAPEADEPAALRAIGTARGDFPTPMRLEGLKTGDWGVLLQLSDFDAGASFVRRQTVEALTSGEDWLLQRGISLVGLTAEGRAEILDRLDKCDPAFDVATHGLWKDRISTPGPYVAHLLLVHDSAYCGDSLDVTAAPLAGLDVPVLRALPARKAYAAVIRPDGTTVEVTNPGFSRLRLYLTPDGPATAGQALALSSAPILSSNAGATAPIAGQAEAKGPVPEAPISAGPVVETAGCLSPKALSPTTPEAPLPVGTRIGEAALQDHLGVGDGWWDAEPFGRWTGSKTASVALVLPDEAAPLSLTVELSTFRATAFTVRALYSGKPLAEVEVAGDKVIQLDLEGVPRAKPVTLVFEMIGPDLTCPAMTGVGGDTRQLGLMLKGLTVTSPGLPAEPQKSVETWPKLDQSPVPAKGCILPTGTSQVIPALSSLPLGELVTVPSATSSGMVAFGPGWWDGEEFGRWMATGSASFALTLPDGPSGLSLSLTAGAFGGTEPTAIIRHEGRDIARGQIGGGRPLVADLSQLPRNRPVILEILLDGAPLACPAALEQSADNRTLVLMLQSMRLSEAIDPQLSPAVAHGGGMLGDAAITNSLDAFTSNQARFDLIEVDLNWTTDGELVCLHDWEDSFASRFGNGQGPVDLATFRNLLAQTLDRPQNCDLETLAEWLRANPNPRMVTDVKTEPIKALALIAQRYPDLVPRFVPQAYQPEEVDQLRALGFDQVIWTLYRFGSDREAIIRAAKAYRPSAITMPLEMAQTGLLAQLSDELDLPLYVHTVNDKAQMACLQAMRATGIYSDTLADADLKSASEPVNCGN